MACKKAQALSPASSKYKAWILNLQYSQFCAFPNDQDHHLHTVQAASSTNKEVHHDFEYQENDEGTTENLQAYSI